MSNPDRAFDQEVVLGPNQLQGEVLTVLKMPLSLQKNMLKKIEESDECLYPMCCWFQRTGAACTKWSS